MSGLSQAETYLLGRIRRGEQEAWAQLVDRYQGRQLAFARSRTANASDAEDLVQEAFLAFLRGLAGFRGEASIETYLFTILRRKIIDHQRGRRVNVCLIQDTMGRADDGADVLQALAGPEPTASWYARRDERQTLQQEALAQALRELVRGYKDALNFRDLELVELLFYCQLPNRAVARIADVKESHVGLLKHRSLKRIRQAVAKALPGDPSPPASDAILTRVWEAQRLSCPKRSTIGAYLLETLEDPWRLYVDFHLNKLGCRFCLANLADLQRQSAGPRRQVLRERIMESTVGFLRRT